MSLTRTVLWLLSLGIFVKSYARATAGSNDEHRYVAPDLFTAETPCGTYQGMTDQVVMSLTPGSFRTVLVPRARADLNGWRNEVRSIWRSLRIEVGSKAAVQQIPTQFPAERQEIATKMQLLAHGQHRPGDMSERGRCVLGFVLLFSEAGRSSQQVRCLLLPTAEGSFAESILLGLAARIRCCSGPGTRPAVFLNSGARPACAGR